MEPQTSSFFDWRNNKVLVGVVVVIVLVGIFFLQKNGPVSFDANFPQVYALVSDKISQSAAVVINLPKGVAKENAHTLVTFEPEIKGRWVETALAESIVFKPDRLEQGKYYRVALALQEGSIQKDFYVDEDPRVEQILPGKDTEADEKSAITVLFNRPMVPLTTLSELEQKSVPISITPATEGRWKWISTRALQFIPKESLHRASFYTVSVSSDLVSLDGLSVKPVTHSFSTRPLRFESVTSGQIVYNEPIRIRFNQPVDLDKTLPALSLRDLTRGTALPVTAIYGEEIEYEKEKPVRRVIDRSTILVFPRADRHGRTRAWDFNTSYEMTLQGALPLDGENPFRGPIATTVSVSDVIRGVSARSERSDQAAADLFDPQGKAVIDFYEPVSLAKTKIRAEGLRDVVYGKKCAEDDGRQDFESCEKVDDPERLELSFDPVAFAPGSVIAVHFERIVNDAGLELNTETITKTLRVFPLLRVTGTSPEQGSAAGSLTSLYICSNSPLKQRSVENYQQAIRSNHRLVFNRWERSYFKGEGGYWDDRVPCAAGDYITAIGYGLLPEKNYELELAFEDEFGQAVQQRLSFRSERPKEFYQRITPLQKQYNVTTPGKTKLTYAAENFEYVDVHVCKLSPEDLLSYSNNLVASTPPDSLPCLAVKRDIVDLPDVFWVYNYFQVDIGKYFADTRGHYLITLSHPNYANNATKLYERTFLSVTNLAVGEKKVQWTRYDDEPEITKEITEQSGAKGAVYWVSEAKSLRPVSGALVRLFTKADNGLPVFARSNATNVSGITEFPLTKEIAGAVVTSGADSAVVSNWADNLNYAGSAATYKKIYVYTDRPIYRPAQEVFVKGIYRLHFDGAHEIFAEKTVPVKIFNPKGEVVLDQKLPVTGFGTFSTRLVLPRDAALGTYRIEVFDSGYGFFEIEEYKAAAFEAKAESDKAEYIAGETASVEVAGKYYFGVPLDGGTLQYTFTAQDYHFDRYTDEYFSFGSGWYHCYECGYGDSYLGGGTEVLSREGTAKITKELDFKKLFKGENQEKSKIIVFHGTLRDREGRQVSVQKSFIVHRGELYLGVKVDPSFGPTGENMNIKVKSVAVDGKAVSAGSIKLSADRVEWKSVKRQEVDGRFYSRWERVLTPIFSRDIRTDRNGDWSDPYAFAEPGEYEITAKAADDRGNEVVAKTTTYVYGAGAVTVRPTNNETLEIVVDKKDVRPGEKAKIILKSPYKQAKALISIERGRIFDYRVVDVNQNFFEFEFDVKSEYAPNVYVSALLLSSGPEIKFGQTEFTVDKSENELKISVTPNKLSYLPGETVSLVVSTKDASGKSVPAEVSIAVADLSVLALKGNPKKNPLVFFYGGLPLTVTTGSNVKNILHEADIPTGTKGGDGSNPDDLAKKKRGEFKDTAFWQAHVVTDASGMAAVSFKLPDNLTRWQIESVGVTEDTKVGAAYQEFAAAKRVMAVPILPRFIVPGDEFYAGVKIFNQTDSKQKLAVSFASDTLVFSDGTKPGTSVSLKAGESETVYFKIIAPKRYEEGAHTLVFTAKNEDFEDVVEQQLPITRNMTYEATATAGNTNNDSAREYVYIPQEVLSDRGGATVKTSATLAVFLSDALEYMSEFPYGCSEQLASKVAALAIVKRSLNLPNVSDKTGTITVEFGGTTYSIDEAVTMGLSRMYESQTANGGFSYYQNLRPDLNLTLHVIRALQSVKRAGFAVREDVIRRAADYAASELLSLGQNHYLKNPYELDSLIVAAYSLNEVGSLPALPVIAGYIRSLAGAAYIDEKISSNALPYLVMLSAARGDLSGLHKRALEELSNRLEIDARGAYLETNRGNVLWSNYEYPVTNTALLLKALVSENKEHSEMANILRWLLSNRSKDGSWGSTNATLTVIDAMTDYLVRSKETEADFNLRLSLNGTPKQTFEFNKKTVFELFLTFVPIAEFGVEKYSVLQFDKQDRGGREHNFYYDIGLKYFLPIEKVSPRDEGISITRAFFDLTDTEYARPLSEAKVGTVVKGRIKVLTPKPRTLFAIEDYIPAGMELVNFRLATEDKTLLEEERPKGGVGYDTKLRTNRATFEKSKSLFGNLSSSLLGAAKEAVPNDLPTVFADSLSQTPVRTLYPSSEELRDDRLFLFVERLPEGEYVYEYYARVTTPGTFSHLPAVASQLYYPEIFGRTAGKIFTVTQ